MVDLEDLNISEADSEAEAEPVPAARAPAAQDDNMFQSRKPARSKGGDSLQGEVPDLDEAPGEVARQIMRERQY